MPTPAATNWGALNGQPTFVKLVKTKIAPKCKSFQLAINITNYGQDYSLDSGGE